MRHIDIDTGLKHRYLKLWHVAQREERASTTRHYAPVPAARGRGGREKGSRKECDNWKQADIYAVCSTSLQATAQAHQQTHIAHILLFQQQQQQGREAGAMERQSQYKELTSLFPDSKQSELGPLSCCCCCKWS